MPITPLPNRAFVKISGDDKYAFLQGLVTVDIQNEAHYCALLSAQGKVLFDFFIYELPEELGGGYLIDIANAFKEDFIKKLTLYKLRAKVTIEDLSHELHAFALWDEVMGEFEGVSYLDPRSVHLGLRIITFKDVGFVETASFDDYEKRRIGACVPQGGLDFIYGDIFPHEMNMDKLGALSFTKGCYVGQEIVARMEHRATTRKRILRYTTQGQTPLTGLEVRSGEVLIGFTGSSSFGEGLALVRLDRLREAKEPIVAGGVILNFGDVDAHS